MGSDIRHKLLIEEVKGLRAEVQSRTSAQHGLISVAATLGTAIAAIALSTSGDQFLLLVLPILFPMIGLLYIDHHVTIARLANHLAMLYLQHGVHDTYQITQSLERRTKLYWFLFGFPIILSFAFVPLCILFISALYALRAGYLRMLPAVLWSVGVVCLMAFLRGAYCLRPKHRLTL